MGLWVAEVQGNTGWRTWRSKAQGFGAGVVVAIVSIGLISNEGASARLQTIPLSGSEMRSILGFYNLPHRSIGVQYWRFYFLDPSRGEAFLLERIMKPKSGLGG